MATIYIDGQSYEVDGSDNLLHACLSLGLDIPYFCWHPALGSVGACRQCAVKQYANADDKRGRIVMSCMTPSTNNTYISIDDEEAKAFRQSVIEFMMINHPHDCPVCEEGGHCHLQDMTVMTGHTSRTYRFSKRTHVNQELGPFIKHEMNRCIACYRCVRYYDEYAGGKDLGVFGAHDNVYFGRVSDGQLESEFSGNLAEVCPTGVFTDKTHSARYSRKWDMQYAPSVCQQCSVGCNTSPGERYGELRRIENRFNGAVNHYFLCDRGRFGYGYVNRADRPKNMLARAGSEFEAASERGGIDRLAHTLRDAKRVIGIGSPRASLEANFALQQWVGTANYSIGVDACEAGLLARALDILQYGAARTPSLREIEGHDAVLILGEDVMQTAPRIALAVRQAVRGLATGMATDKNVYDWQTDAVNTVGQHERNPLFIASVDTTRLDDIASKTWRAGPADIATLGFAVAHAIDSSAPAPASTDAELGRFAATIAQALCSARKPLIISGTGLRSAALLDASANIAAALKARGVDAAITLALPEANSMGVAMLGGLPIEEALAAVDPSTVLVVLENDLFRRAAESSVATAMAAARCVIVIDHQLTATAERAHMVLPAASFAEGDGTLVNNEGRAQRFFQVYDPAYYNLASQIRESWRWIAGLQSAETRNTARWETLDQITAACALANPVLAGIVGAAPGADFRMNGLRIARQPQRYSGRTAMRSNISMHEPRTPQDSDSALTFSMEGYTGTNEPGSLVPFAWAPGWNSPQAWNKFQDEVGGHLRDGDSGVRLIEASATAAYAIPAAPPNHLGTFEVAPLAHIFGSEELSARAPVMADNIPALYVALNPRDAATLGLVESIPVRVSIGNTSFEAPLVLRSALATGVVGIPAGLPGAPFVFTGTAATLAVGGSA